jgi:hypothetical protein
MANYYEYSGTLPKALRLKRVEAQMRARYLYTGSGCAAQRRAREQRIAKAQEKRRE